MEDKFYAISTCCNSHTWNFPQSVYECLMGHPKTTICYGCGEVCDIEVKPAYTKISKGIYRQITYNKKKL